MEVNGFQLPADFVLLCQAIREGELPTMWEHGNDVDAYGLPWEGGDLTIDYDPKDIENQTNLLWRLFHEEKRFLQDAQAYGQEPGFILNFADVSKLVWFGSTGWGGPYCFDFQENLEEPSVVHWDSYWRRLTPDFASFIALFQTADEAEPYEATEEEWAEALPPPRSLFDRVAASYARMSEEEQREFEEQLKKERGNRGLGDTEELLERLRARVAR